MALLSRTARKSDNKKIRDSSRALSAQGAVPLVYSGGGVFRANPKSNATTRPGVASAPAKLSQKFRNRYWTEVCRSSIALRLHRNLQVLFKLFCDGVCLFRRNQPIGNQIIYVVVVNAPVPQSRQIHFFHLLNGANKSSIAFCAFFKLCLSIWIST